MVKKGIKMKKSINTVLIIALLVVIGGIAGWKQLFYGLDDTDWVIRRSVMGNVTSEHQAGALKWRAFAKITPYPKNVQKFYSKDPREGSKEDESISITFNDGGKADLSMMVRYKTPTNEDECIQFHREFQGDIENCNDAIRAWLINCAKATAPIMSATENQSARKSEFNNLLYNQLTNGLYEMARTEKVLKDQFDEEGRPITVFATEIITDDKGVPRIAQKSPLPELGIVVNAFSITGTEYDPQTQKMFEAKKESMLLAEQMKIDREREVQNRLMIVEKYEAEKAEVEGEANKEKAQAVIAAEKDAEVAIQAKVKAETEASQKLEVAKIAKEEALTEAQMKLEVADLALQSAELEAKAIEVLAAAEREKIELAGAMTEQEQVRLEKAVERDIGVATAIAGPSGIQVPHFVIASGSGSSGDGTKTLGSGGVQENLFNLLLLERAGAIPAENLNHVQKAVIRPNN
jgi:hypothetical protein